MRKLNAKEETRKQEIKDFARSVLKSFAVNNRLQVFGIVRKSRMSLNGLKTWRISHVVMKDIQGELVPYDIGSVLHRAAFGTDIRETEKIGGLKHSGEDAPRHFVNHASDALGIDINFTIL